MRGLNTQKVGANSDIATSHDNDSLPDVRSSIIRSNTDIQGGLIPVEVEDVRHYSIILMGPTGTGKSSFISLLKGVDIGVSHSLESCTARAKEYEIQLDPGRVLHLIDTPGFNDTHRKDSDILSEIASFLTAIYQYPIELGGPVDLHGILFLHRITDPRMTGASLRNLRIVEKLCGNAAIEHLALVSTMWDKLEHRSLGESRERDLLQNSNFWQPLQAAGAIVSRHDGSAKSARSIVEEIIRRGSTVLEIQRQMVDQHCSLDQTTVGQYLQADLLEARKKHEKELEELEEALKEAIEDKDDKLIQVLTEQREAQADLLSHSKREQERLKFSSEQLGPTPSESWAELKAQITEDEKKWEDEILHLKAQIEGLQSGRSQDMKQALSDREALIVHNKRLEHSAIIQQQNYEHERKVLEDQVRRIERELRRHRQRARSTAISDLFSFSTYDGNTSYRNEAMAYGRSYPSSSSRDNGRNLQRRGTHPAPYQDMSQRTFRSSGGSQRWY